MSDVNRPKVNRQWVKAATPDGAVKVSDFKFTEGPVPDIQDGEFLVRSNYLSVAPVMRRYLIDGAGIEKPLDIGDVMHGRGVGTIVESKHPDFAVGEIVQGKLGWQDYSVLTGEPGTLCYKVKQHVAPISTAIGVLGMTGWTSYVSLKDIGKVKPGETVVVSGAAGGVGNIAGQVARNMGAHVIGIAGGAEKCAMIKDKLGYHAAIDYKAGSVSEQLSKLAPDGIDIFFDNVGGEILDDVLMHINMYARVISCGRISQYLVDEPYRLRNWEELCKKRAKFEAFFVYDYEHMFEEAEIEMAQWIADGKLTYSEDMLEGLERMPDALIRLYDGKNVGKQIVHIAG